MRFFESNREVLKLSAPAKTSKRFAACVIDMVLVALVADLLFMGLLQITKNSEAYKTAEDTIAEEIAYYEELTEDTHIVEYVDGVRVSVDVMVLKNISRAICLSYQLFGNAQQPDFEFAPDHDVTINGVHSAETDNIAYFYTVYAAENPDFGIEAERDIFEIYKKSFGDDAAFMFTFNREISDIPVLNTQVAYYLFRFLFVDSSDSIGQTGRTYYESYFNAYSNMLEEAESLILLSEPYNSTHYARYKEAYCAQARYTNISLVISVVISCFIILLIPRYLFGDGKTMGYKLLDLGVIRTNGDAIKWYVSFIRTAVSSVGFIPIAFILYLFPPFNGGYEAMFVPATPDSSISLALVILVISVVGALACAVGLFTDKNRNLMNLILDDLTVDANYPYDVSHTKVTQGREY